MAAAKKGDKVRVHYTGKLENGEVFDSSEGREPLEFTIGEGMIIPGFENAVSGLEVGAENSITIPPEEAYGAPRLELINNVNREHLPQEIEPVVGMQLQATAQDGSAMPVTITAVTEESVTVDANHPLAGRTLLFDIKLVEIV